MHLKKRVSKETWRHLRMNRSHQEGHTRINSRVKRVKKVKALKAVGQRSRVAMRKLKKYR